MLEALQYDFFRNAVIGGLLAGALCGLIGPFVVLQRLVFLTGGLAHAAFAGVGICYFFGLDPRLGALTAALVAAIFLWGSQRRSRFNPDATVGVLWAVGMAIGFVFLSRTPGYAPDLMGFLFGDILTVSQNDLAWLAALAVAGFGFVALFYHQLVAIAFDAEHAEIRGVPVRGLGLGHLVLVTMSVVLLIQVVGVVLVIALVTLPTLIALPLVRGFGMLIGASILVAAATTVGGLGLSYRFDLPSGAAIVLLGASALGVARGSNRVLRPRVPTRSVRDE